MSAVYLSQINLRTLCILGERPTRDTSNFLRAAMLILTHMSRDKKGPYSDWYLLFIRDSSSITKSYHKI